MDVITNQVLPFPLAICSIRPALSQFKTAHASFHYVIISKKRSICAMLIEIYPECLPFRTRMPMCKYETLVYFIYFKLLRIQS